MTFEDIYQKYGGKVLNLTFRFTGNEETARDLTQDIFLKIYRNLESFEQRSQLYTWIYRITVNHCLNFLKKERRWRRLSLMDEKVTDMVKRDQLLNPDTQPGSTPPSDKMVERSQREQVVRTCLNQLPFKYRAPLILQRYEGMNNQEIAETLSVSVGAVETRLHRAKKMLIKKLQPWIPHL